MNVAALDIGGANLKAARLGGRAFSLPFALWKAPDELHERLAAVLSRLAPVELLAVTMTGELCDCFSTKSEGVLHILDAVERAARDAAPAVAVRVFTVAGDLVSLGAARRRPLDAAAANWLALATWVAREHRDSEGVLVDIGSTTSDVIAFRGGEPLVCGRDDTSRLASGELAYCGARRTPVCALVSELVYRGERCRVAAELFATLLDVHIVLGEIVGSPLDCDTADGRPATLRFARDRLARMLCVDPPEFSLEDARSVASQVRAAAVAQLRGAVERVLRRHAVVPRTAVLAGSGELLARSAVTASELRFAAIVSLEERFGAASSTAACAVALAHLAAAGTGR